MSSTSEVLRKLRENPKGVRFAELARICERYFGEPRSPGTGDPRVNIQNDKGMAKPYQVRQVIKALEKLEERDG